MKNILKKLFKDEIERYGVKNLEVKQVNWFIQESDDLIQFEIVLKIFNKKEINTRFYCKTEEIDFYTSSTQEKNLLCKDNLWKHISKTLIYEKKEEKEPIVELEEKDEYGEGHRFKEEIEKAILLSKKCNTFGSYLKVEEEMLKIKNKQEEVIFLIRLENIIKAEIVESVYAYIFKIEGSYNAFDLVMDKEEENEIH